MVSIVCFGLGCCSADSVRMSPATMTCSAMTLVLPKAVPRLHGVEIRRGAADDGAWIERQIGLPRQLLAEGVENACGSKIAP